MKLLAVLMAGCLVAVAPAQFIITEVHTGTPDFVEITNISGAPAPVAGLGITCSNNSVCPSASLATASGGAYVTASAVIVPPGGTYIFEDLGVAGAAALTAPLIGPGEHTGWNMSWAGGSHGEVALYSGAVLGPAPGLITGTALDYMVFQFNVVAPVPGPGNPIADYYHFNPAGPLGLWLSEPISRAAGLDTLFRVSVAGVYTDSDANADWNAVASVAGILGTPGAPNPPGVAPAPTPGVDLAYSAPGGPGSIAIDIITANPIQAGAEFYNLISLAPLVCANGPIFGLPADVIGIITAPLGTPIFHDFLSPVGDYPVFIPFGVPGGIAIQSRVIVNVGGLWSLASNTVFYTT